jgi:hypothetical protein
MSISTKLIQAAAGNLGDEYTIDNSLRFNDDDSAYLSRTPATASNRKTFTFSAWVKRGNLSGVRQGIFTKTNSAGNAYWAIEFETNDTINVYDSNTGGSTAVFSTNAVFRDVSGWYHIVVAIDTTQATSTNRAKLYINGIEITSFTDVNYPPLNNDTVINLAEQHSIGSWQPLTGAGYYFDGYLAETHFIDGQALTPDDFGEISATTGEWSPIAYEGTYGTNGFYLPFDGNANDSSGNGNNWTENNLASTDYMLDTPTNNFSTINPIGSDSNSFYSEGNLKFLSSSSGTNFSRGVSSIPVSSGKWYFEMVGVGDMLVAEADNYLIYSSSVAGSGEYSYGFFNGNKNHDGLSVSYGDSFSGTDVIGCALDLDAGSITFYKNNVSQGVAFTGLTATSYIVGSLQRLSRTTNFNFGADSSFAGLKTRQGNTDANGKGDFYYEPAAGFLALCEDNLETLPFSASGGTETTITDGGVDYKVHTFTSSDTLYVQGIGQVEYLVVGGGGGGGAGSDNNQGGGGGGAGGYRSSVFSESSGGGASAEPKLAVSAGSYTVTVGGGASVGALYGGVSGNPSSFGGITSAGGGGGGSSRASDTAATSGGSGGGEGSLSGRTGASGTSGQGFDGASGSSGNAGGGGGAGEAGNTDSLKYGGDGVASNITGSSVVRAGGGGGGAGIGGDGGGGDGGADGGNNTGLAGTINTGGGGGGGWRETSGDPRGGNGGSGIVIIRYPI